MASAISLSKPVKEKHQTIATLLAFALLPLSGFATDIYIPSLPGMAGALHTTNIAVQMTLTLFLIGYGVSQLFVGGLIDSFGRYAISLSCLIVFGLANIVIATTHSILVIDIMRVIHGVTVGGVIVAKRAYFIDVFTGDKLKHYLSLFSIVWSTGPIVAPFIGGYLEAAFGWKSNFYFLAGFAFVLAALDLAFGGESIRHVAKFHLKQIANTYLQMFRTTTFSLGLIMVGLSYCIIMIFNLTGPFIIEHTLGLSPVTAGYSSLILGVAWLTGGMMGKATINKPFFKRVSVNLFLQTLFVIAMLIASRIISNLYTLIFFAFIIHVAAGFTFNNFFTYCLGRFPKNAGIASGLSGGVNYVIVSALSYSIIAFLPAKDAINLGYSYAVLVVISLAILFFLSKNKAALS